MKGRVDECMAWGALSGMTGLFLYADALGGGRAYGYTSGSVIEFVLDKVFGQAGGAVTAPSFYMPTYRVEYMSDVVLPHYYEPIVLY